MAAALDAIDVSSCDAAGLVEVTALARRLAGYADAVLARVAERAVELHAEGSSPMPVDVLTSAGRVSARQAGRVVRRAETLAATPTLAAALSAGAISADHADALANTVAKLDDDTKAAVVAHDAELARVAARTTPERFAAHCRQLATRQTGDDGLGVYERQRRQTGLRRWVDDTTGMYRLDGAFDPITGHRLWSALDREVDALRTDRGQADVVDELAGDNQHLAAHALVGLVSAAHQARRPAVAEIAVHIDVDTLRGDLAEGGVCELADGTTIPAAVARRLACQAGLIPIVLDGDGIVLDVGRSRRLATTAQRTALRAMYTTCAFGCDVPFDHCQIHHLTPWSDGGATDLADLIPACNGHHHQLHEHGWTAHLDQARTLHLYRPDGTLHASHPLPARQRQPERQRQRDRAREARQPEEPPPTGRDHEPRQQQQVTLDLAS